MDFTPKKEQQQEEDQWRELNPRKLRSRMDSEDDFMMELGEGGQPAQLQAGGDHHHQQQENTNNSNNWCIMDIPEDVTGGDDDDDTEKPKRKMTSTSEGTSVTAASSFYDDSGDGNHFNEKPVAALDKLPEADGEEGCEDDGVDDEEKLVEPVDSCGWKWLKRIVGFWIIFGLLGLITVLIGAAVEKRDFYEAEDTKSLYATHDVCGIDTLADVRNSTSTTYSSAQEAHASGDMVAHCGHCGSCSTAHDLEIMARTTDSLTSDTARCAFKIFIGRRAVEKCMEERVGFTSDCEDCWLDNIQCSFKSCKWTCIKWKLFRQENNNGVSLNDCLKCDERMCGPQFIECSGSNRRRMGIVSDIGRDAEKEQCAEVDVDWLSQYDS